jgi:iron complex transport system substrate-binding protein
MAGVLVALAAFTTLAIVSAFGLRAAAAEPPQRIVSLNLCVDAIVLDLVPRERIRGVSLVSADPNVSAIADRVRGLTLTRGGAEDVLALDPDLVLAGEYTTTATVDLLRRLGRRVEVVPLATDLDGIRAAIRQIASAVGEEQRGVALIAAFDARLAGARPQDAKRPTALLYQMSGLASTPGSLADALFAAAGLQNKSALLNVGRGGSVALESLVEDPPDLMALGQDPSVYRTLMADNLRHPALSRLLASRAHVNLPMPLWLCGTPRVTEAATLLAAARANLLARERK